MHIKKTLNSHLKQLCTAVLLTGSLMLQGCHKTESPSHAVTEAPVSESETAAKASETPTVSNVPIISDPSHQDVLLDITIKDFNALGFQYGDSVNVYFSNGHAWNDVPYYSGYYANDNEPLVVGYYSSTSIKLTYQNNFNPWQTVNLADDDTVTIELNERGKYIKIQETFDINYSNDRSQYASDEIFANFRPVSCSTIRENYLYRSASPCNNSANRAEIADALAKDANIRCVLDLSETKEAIEESFQDDSYQNPYYEQLYKEGNVIIAKITYDFNSDSSKEVLSSALRQMSEHEGPYLIHCKEGKDRTGFICFILEALAGSTYDEIEKDYMITYANYYGITKENDPEKYQLFVDHYFRDLINAARLENDIPQDSNDLSMIAEAYLESIGLTSTEITALKSAISK